MAGFAKDLLHLVEEPALGINGVAGGVLRIHAVLGDQQHAIHLKLVGAQSERFLHGVVNGHIELLGPFAARVTLGHLIGVKRNQLEVRTLALAIERIREDQTADDHVRMRVVPILRHNGSDPLGRRREGGYSDEQEQDQSVAPWLGLLHREIVPQRIG